MKMCIILVCKTEKPSLEILKNCSYTNTDGAGISWREKTQVKWSKGHTVDEIYELTKCLKLPFVIHFRMSTVGGVTQELCHPFSVTPTVTNALTGKAKQIIMHNGHWADWQESLKANMIYANGKVPDGAWSDSRAIAYFTNNCGSGFLRLLEEKVVLFSSKDIQIFGDGWTDEVDGIIYSNTGYLTNWGVAHTKTYKNKGYNGKYYDKYEDPDYAKELYDDEVNEKCRNAVICSAEYMD